MAKRVVNWSFNAKKQRREILKYWTLKNGSSYYSEKLIKQSETQIKTILNNPKAFRLAAFHEIRVSSLGHFSIYY